MHDGGGTGCEVTNADTGRDSHHLRTGKWFVPEVQEVPEVQVVRYLVLVDPDAFMEI